MIGPRALLVDLDGTLVDTAEANYRAYADALAAVGVTLAREWWEGHAMGRSWRQFLPPLLAGTGADPAAVAAAKARAYAGQLGATRVNAALVAWIGASRPVWRAALVTTASAANAHAVLAHHDLARLFDTVVTGDDVAQHKPAPDAYRLAAGRLGIAAADCIVIEDSTIGIAAAAAFGAPCLRVTGMFST